jgi:hypothetical protein
MAKAKDGDDAYVALTPIEHDGIAYAEGSVINLPETSASNLLNTGAIAPQ